MRSEARRSLGIFAVSNGGIMKAIVVKSRGEKKFLVCTLLQELKKGLHVEKLGRPQSQQIHIRELLARAS